MEQKRKGMGIITKVLLFSLVPGYLIIGIVLFLNQQGIMNSIKERYIQESLSVSQAVQNSIQKIKIFRNPDLLNQALDLIASLHSQVHQITLYAEQDGGVVTIASTDPEKIGKKADFHDAETLLTGNPMIKEMNPEGLHLMETVTPLYKNGERVAAVGVFVLLTPWDDLRTELTQKTLWFGLSGGAVILALVFVLIHRVLLGPVKVLANGAEVMAQGNLNQRIPVKADDEIGVLTRSFNAMGESLKKYVEQMRQKKNQFEQKNKELENFVYTVSHDLKSPLVALQGMADILLEDYERKLDEQGRHYLGRLTANASQMERLIQDLLELSRIGRLENKPENVDLNPVVHEIMEQCRMQFPSQSVTFETSCLPSVWGDPVRIRQVFQNLISNAYKFLGNRADPRIEIGYREDPEKLVFWVKDNGIGIDTSHHQRIFGIFQRLQEVEAEGTGVGLTIVKQVVEGRGGTLWVESEKGKGAAFFFTWPKPDPKEKSAQAFPMGERKDESGFSQAFP